MTITPVARLAVIAACLPDAVLVEDVLDAPYADVWRIASDLERGVPRFESSVVAVEIVEHHAERLAIVVETQQNVRVPMNVVLREGYCLMQSARACVGMAARPQGNQTRFAHFEALPGEPVAQKTLISELRTLEKLARAGA